MEYVSFPEVVWFQEGPGVRNTQYTATGIKLLNVANLVEGKVDISNTNRYISEEEAYGKYKHFLVDKGDLIIASSGIKVEYFDKKMGFVDESQLPLCMNTSTIRFKALDETVLDIRYFMYFLKSDCFKAQLGREITGSAQLNFGPSHLKKMKLPLIDIQEQHHVASVLDKVTDLIAQRRAQLNKLDLLVKSRFVEMFGDISVNDRGWEVQPLGSLCSIVRGGSPRPIEQYLGGTIPWIKIGDATEGDSIYLRTTKDYIIPEGVKKSRLINAGSLIFANCGVSLGFARIITFDGCIHDGWLALQDIDSRINKIFLLQCLNQMTEHFRKIAPIGTQPNLNTSIMKNYGQIVPPLKLQNEFVDFLLKAIELRAAAISSIKKMQDTKSALMQKYFG